MLQAIFKAIAERDAATALSLAEQAVAEQPEQHTAVHALGLAQQLAGQLDAAAASFDRAIAMAPHEARYHLARAALAMGQGDLSRADAAVSSAVESDPNRLGAYVFAAHLGLARGDAEEVSKQLKLAQKVNPEHPIVLAIEGNLAELQGDRDKAIKLLAVAAQASPEDPIILASLGLSYLRAGHHAFAEQALRSALNLRPDVVRLRWALVEALRQQDRHQDLPEALQPLVEQPSEAGRALALLGDCLLRQGKVDEAVAAYRRLLQLRPLHLPALDGVVDVLVRVGLADRARGLIEELLAAEPDNDEFWQRRIALDAQNPAEVDAALERWRTALPDSAIMHGVAAQIAEARGQLERAEASADASLAQHGSLVGPLQVKMRALLRRDPSAALQLAERIGADAKAEYGRQLAAVWRGFALDRLSRGDAASAVWHEHFQTRNPNAELPAVTPLAAAETAADADAVQLLWGPPGSRVLELVGLLRRVPEFAMLDDRFGAGARPDGLWPVRADGAIARAAGWRQLLERAKLNPDRAVDWLPHWDGRVDAVLPGALLIAVIDDPRDLLLNALVFGGPQPWPMPKPAELATWLAQALDVLAERAERQPERTLLVRAQALREDPAAVMGRVAQALGIDAPSVDGLEQARTGPGQMPLCFEPGHWRALASGFAAEFEQLAPVAARLGFA